MKRVLFVLVLWLGSASAQDAAKAVAPSDLASLLPAETLLLCEADDLGGFERWSKETAMGRIFAEPEMQAFWQNLHKSVYGAMKMWGGTLGMVGLKLEDFEGIEIRRVGLALVDGDVSPPRLDAVLTIQSRKGGDKVGKIVGALRQSLSQWLGVPFDAQTIRGREVWHTRADPIDLYFMAHGDRVLVTTQYARTEQMLKALDEGQPQSLKTAPRYANIMKRMGADRSALTMYADVKAMHAKGLAIARRVADGRGRRQTRIDEFEMVWSTLGLDSVEALAMADVPAGTGFRTEFAITHTGARRGLFRVLSNKPVDHRFARFAPERCFCYGAENWNAEEVLQAIADLYVRFEPRGQEHIDRGLQEITKHLGIDLKEDVIKALGDDWAVFVGAPPGGGMLPDIALVAGVKDRARLEKAMDTMALRICGMAAEKHGRLKVKEALFRNLRIKFFESPDMPLAPAWAFGEDYVMFALAPQTIKNAHAQKASLAGNAEFRALQQRIPAGASSVTWLNTKDIVGWLYNTMTPVLQSMQGVINEELRPFGAELNFHDLPPAETILKHLSGTMSYTSVEDGCVRMGFVSPFGSSMLMAGVTAIGMVAGLTVVLVEKGAAEEMHVHDREARRNEEVQRLRARLAAQRKKYEARVRAIERQLAELKRQIEELR